MSSFMMAQWLNGQQILTYHLIHLANQTCKRSRICFLAFWDKIKIAPSNLHAKRGQSYWYHLRCYDLVYCGLRKSADICMTS